MVYLPSSFVLYPSIQQIIQGLSEIDKTCTVPTEIVELDVIKTLLILYLLR